MNPSPDNSSSAVEPIIISTRSIPKSRQQIFEAFRDPKLLAQWWGPTGFRNTFHVFEFRPGGKWSFVMHGPDGTDYKNENVFLEIMEPGHIVIEHVGWPEFQLTTTLAEEDDGKTAIHWRMVFQSVADCEKVRDVCLEANQQNFDRLEAVLNATA